MEFFVWLQETSLATWVASAPTLLAYPTILSLHTAGMAVVVGVCTVIDLRVLGVAPAIPLTALQRAPRLLWSGFAVNAITGGLLFLPTAELKATQTVFIVKLACIFLALAVYGRIRRIVFADSTTLDAPIVTEAKWLAVVSLLLWTGATVAGRLMAYLL